SRFARDLTGRFESDGSRDDAPTTRQKSRRSMSQARPHGFVKGSVQSLCRLERGGRKREPVGRFEIPAFTEIVMSIRNRRRRSLLHVAAALFESLAGIPPPRHA